MAMARGTPFYTGSAEERERERGRLLQSSDLVTEQT